ncbi:MAG TPA: nuclear transport factor 2 family protein, partial [Vicingus sp.]|nr:nuclear transport factor 2 family protein [Vicingus sp.]
MKNFLLLFIIILFSNNIKAQNDTLAINQVITQLFDGMRTSDSNLVKNVFHTEATLQTVFTNKTDETKLHEEQISEFAKAVGTPH